MRTIFRHDRNHPARCWVIPIMALLALGFSVSEAEVHVGSSSSDYRTTTVFSSGQGDHWTMGASRNDGHLSMDARGIAWQLHFTYTYPTGDLRFGLPDQWNWAEQTGSTNRFRGKLVLFEPSISSRLRAGLWHDRAALEIESRVRTDDLIGLMAGVRLRPTDFLTAGIRRGHVHPEPAASELYYDFTDLNGEFDRVGGTLDWSIPTWLTEVEIAVNPAQGLSLSSKIRDADMTPTSPTMSGEPSGNYRLALSGTACDGTAAIEYTLTPNWRGWANARHVRLDARLMGYDGGERFAHFGIVHAYFDRQSVGIQYRRSSFSVGSGSGEGALMGSVEVWPFATGLLRLLGERRQIVVEGTLRWKEAALCGPMVTGRWFNLEAAVDWLRLQPEATLKTWRPAVFGISIDDLKSDRLDLVRADLVRLRLMPSVRIREFLVAFDVSQWIPVSVRKQEKPSGSVGPGTGVPSDEGGGRRTWGGFSASVRLSVGAFTK